MIRMNKITDHILAILRKKFDGFMDGGMFEYPFESPAMANSDRSGRGDRKWDITRNEQGMDVPIVLSWDKMFIEAEVPA